MANRRACDDIQAAWDALSVKWSAEVKSRYYNQLLLPLLDEAEGMYQRNDSLESYAETCLRSLHIYKEG